MEEPRPSERELDAIRERAERFLTQREDAEYLHYSGQQPTLDLEPIFEEHEQLFRLDTVQRVGAAVEGRRNRELWRFLCEGNLAAATRPFDERIAEQEATLEAVVDGRTIPYRELPSSIANADARQDRERIEEARVALDEEHLVPLRVEQYRALGEAARGLGVANVLELYRDHLGVDLDGLAAQCVDVLDATERLYAERMDRTLREETGVGLADAEVWDLRRWARSPKWDAAFPADRMLPALRSTLSDLGIDLDTQENIELDVEHRPTKLPRAFCSPIEVPNRVLLVIRPMGGPDDWLGLFHEAGHAEHFAGTSRSLTFEERRLGDFAVTEGWAALLQLLVAEPAWLSRRLDFPKPHEFGADDAVRQLFLLRRYAAKLLYELELHAAEDPLDVRDRYRELLGDAVRIRPRATDWLADVDPGFYAASYLRSWAFEAQLRSFLREEFGDAWFARREAGSLLRELWELGQQPTADELLHDVAGAELHLGAAVERIEVALR